MKHVWTKALALICVALLVLSLAACGENNKNAGSGNDASSTVSSKADSTAANDAASSSAVSNDASSDASSDAGSDAEAGEVDPALVGSWEYEGGSFIYTFNSDGTGTYDVGAEDVMTFTYKTDGSKISFLYKGNTEPMELEYVIDGDTLNVKDSFGSDTIYKRK